MEAIHDFTTYVFENRRRRHDFVTVLPV